MRPLLESLGDAQRAAVELSNQNRGKAVVVTKSFRGGLRYGIVMEGDALPKEDKVLDVYLNGLIEIKNKTELVSKVKSPVITQIQQTTLDEAKQAVNKKSEAEPAATKPEQKAETKKQPEPVKEEKKDND